MAQIKAVEYFLPEQILSNDTLAATSDRWTAEKILDKTGIAERRVSNASECASDLAVSACQKLFDTGVCRPDEIDFLLLCTQSPDYLLPTTACLVQDRLGLPKTCGALDFNLGCSGYVYGLGLAKGLIETGQAKNILLVTAETYTKFIQPQDLNVRTLFGDGATATLVQATKCDSEQIGPFVYGTDGSGAENLIVRGSGSREPNHDSNLRLEMNGPDVFAFTLRAVPDLVRQLLDKTGLSMDDVRYFVFHQASEYMLRHLREKIQIPTDRFCIAMRQFGNTVSSTIPVALSELSDRGEIQSGDHVVLVGFGVGYSWAATVVRW